MSDTVSMFLTSWEISHQIITSSFLFFLSVFFFFIKSFSNFLYVWYFIHDDSMALRKIASTCFFLLYMHGFFFLHAGKQSYTPDRKEMNINNPRYSWFHSFKRKIFLSLKIEFYTINTRHTVCSMYTRKTPFLSLLQILSVCACVHDVYASIPVCRTYSILCVCVRIHTYKLYQKRKGKETNKRCDAMLSSSSS